MKGPLAVSIVAGFLFAATLIAWMVAAALLRPHAIHGMDVHVQSSGSGRIRGTRLDGQRTIICSGLWNACGGDRTAPRSALGMVVRCNIVHRQYKRRCGRAVATARLATKRIGHPDWAYVSVGSTAAASKDILPGIDRDRPVTREANPEPHQISATGA